MDELRSALKKLEDDDGDVEKIISILETSKITSKTKLLRAWKEDKIRDKVMQQLDEMQQLLMKDLIQALQDAAPAIRITAPIVPQKKFEEYSRGNDDDMAPPHKKSKIWNDANFFVFGNAKSMVTWFHNTYDNKNERVPPRLVKSFGADWPLKGRDKAIEQMMSIIMKRIGKHGTKHQDDRFLQVVPFVGSVPGGGKSALNEKMVPMLQKIASSPVKAPLSDCVTILLGFMNGSALTHTELCLLNEHPEKIAPIVAFRILYCYFVQGNQPNDNSETSFGTFLTMMYEQPDAFTLSLEYALEAIEFDQRINCGVKHEVVMIYLGIDEYQSLSANVLKNLVIFIGRTMCNSRGYFLIPLFTGADYNHMFNAIHGSSFSPQALAFELPSRLVVNALLDELGKKYEFLKFWRLWSDFRRNLEDFQGYMRGIEWYIEELHNCCSTMSFTHADAYLYHVSKINIQNHFANVKAIIRSKYFHTSGFDVAKLVYSSLLRVPVGRSEEVSNGVTFEQLEKIGMIVLQDNKVGTVTVHIPYIFLSIFVESGALVDLSVFEPCKWWQDWEEFNQQYIAFTESVFAKTYTSISAKTLFQGAICSSDTCLLTVPLSKDVYPVKCLHQFPNNKLIFGNSSAPANYKEESIWKHNTVVMNAVSSPFADIFQCRPGIFIATQCKHGESANTISYDLIKKELEKNRVAFEKLKQVPAFQALENYKQDACKLLTVIKTTKHISCETLQKLQEEDDIIIVSKDQFRAFYGDTFADRAWFAAGT